ncbi:matrixin family metalloprotease [Paenarthrobacter aromaticivorans]|uniref:Matrixin family metalloprotease n=1 Tax=Paenarthrobacter aromaticivorans TaxID=2849150 RepID=A0ABS6IAU8_9MICC|nr:matrixin family metalloprotease [Paenarthrobacter sp. MMS21-TAE1-1]MBU8867968.1 matrixin family metalloprotease [Paenarthrobacter sp. MMS21-TAE1-1]
MRILRGVLMAGVAAVVAVLVSGLLHGDPRIIGLFPGVALPNSPKSEPIEQTPARALDAPPPGIDEADAPLASPPPPASASDSYKFLATNDDGTPVGYSPCRPLHYVVNAATAPEGTDALLATAIANISAASGIQFINDGSTDELPTAKREPYQPSKYGDRWAPLLISWTTPETAPALADTVIGTGGSTMYSLNNGPKSYITGSLELDTPQVAELLAEEGGSDYVLAVMQHELGHVMGLDHVGDPVQLMYPEIGAPDGLAAGDLNGLHLLASAPCRKDI